MNRNLHFWRKNSIWADRLFHIQTFWPIYCIICPKMTPFAIKITIVRLISWKFSGVRRVFSTGKFALIRVPQYWIIGVKGGCKGTEYSKVLKKPLSSSTGIVSDTLIYHNACIDWSKMNPYWKYLFSQNVYRWYKLI